MEIKLLKYYKNCMFVMCYIVMYLQVETGIGNEY